MKTPHTIVIGAGIGGLTTAALLVKAGHRVTVLEAHSYPGGSAGTFYNRGYRFDAGATLAGGFASGGPHARLGEYLGLEWPIHPVDPAWVVHLPGTSITQWSDPARWQAERQEKLPGSEPFWQVQERLAALAWDLSSRSFPWPPESLADIRTLAAAMRPETITGAAPYLFRTVGQMIPRATSPDPRTAPPDLRAAPLCLRTAPLCLRAAPPDLRAFLDAQLLISAQTTAAQASALYGSAALDLPRRGVNAVRTGIGGLAQVLVRWIRENGGVVYFQQQVEQVCLTNGRVTGCRTRKGLEMACDFLVANLTPWGLASLLGENAPPRLQHEVRNRAPGWGAFILYLGLENRLLPQLIADHHQVIVDPARPLGEGNSVFISLSDPGDPTRAPAGMRAATLSTHTAVDPWWELAKHDPQAFGDRKAKYTERVLQAAELALPGIRQAVRLCLPGTPVTFQFYTRRPLGMVGGFPQTSIFHARSPWTGLANAWLVGDSVFPGQSTAGTTLGGWRVADAILRASRA